MAKADSIIAIDIGGDSLKIAEFSCPPEGGITLENFAFSEYGGDQQEEDLMDSLQQILKSAISDYGFKAKKVHLSISGQSSFIRSVTLPPVGDEEERVKQIVEYEAKQNVPFPMNEVVWDYQLISTGDEEDAEIEVMFVVVKNDFISRITKIVEEMGKEVVLIEVAPTASYNAARANEVGSDDCEMILNIGGRCSSLIFIDSGRFYVRTIPIAGHSITQQISKEFGIPFADAEEMKRRHGFVALGGAYEEPDSEVAATVSKIVRNVMTRLHGEINRSINVYRSQRKGKKPGKLYLAGGSSVMAFTPRFFSEKLRIPVDYFNPFQVVSLSDKINKENLAEVAHMFSEVIGLGLRYITVCPIEISLIPDILKKQHELKQKVPYFYASALTLVMCLLVSYWGVYEQQKRDEERVNMAQNAVKRVTNLKRDVNSAKSTLETIGSKFEDAKDILNKRTVWIKILDELQTVLPPRMWLTSISGSSSGKEVSRPSNTPVSAGSMFNNPFGISSQHQSSTTTTPSEIGWLVVEGHSLVGNSEKSLEDEFKERLVKSDMFTNIKEEIRTIYYIPVKGNNNITTFKMEIKLKTPIKI